MLPGMILMNMSSLPLNTVFICSVGLASHLEEDQGEHFPSTDYVHGGGQGGRGAGGSRRRRRNANVSPLLQRQGRLNRHLPSLALPEMPRNHADGSDSLAAAAVSASGAYDSYDRGSSRSNETTTAASGLPVFLKFHKVCRNISFVFII